MGPLVASVVEACPLPAAIREQLADLIADSRGLTDV